jgi:xanthine dehydrogenase YagR molybdenum-binding subunit
MRECLEQGAQRFGWAKRSAKPRSMRDGRYLVGQGVASAIYTHWRWPAKARVVLNADGTALVETGSHELGGGTYTVMRQVAADTLGIPVERILVHIGDTTLPAAHASIGSATMANTGAAVLLAAQAARDQAVRLATGGKNAPFKGVDPKSVRVANGGLTADTKAGHVSYAQLLRANGLKQLPGDGDYNPVEEYKGPKAIFSFSAVYAEVRVDEDLGLARVSRVVGTYDAGRIINARTARSQAIGGIIWGIGQALLEQSEVDSRTARFLNRNCSGYLIPSNSDVPDLDVAFAGGFDSEASILGAKGLGELTAVSVAPAIVNAIYHATGKRIRELPVTIDKLL